jgi:hypothetical protein
MEAAAPIQLAENPNGPDVKRLVSGMFKLRIDEFRLPPSDVHIPE